MIECLLAWACLVIGALEENAQMMIASGLFAVAAQLSMMRKGQ